MESQSLTNIIIYAWQLIARDIASGNIDEPAGQKKEMLVFCYLRRNIEQISPGICVYGPDTPAEICGWRVDLICSRGEERIAVEGKFKVLSDKALPDNRKAAFFDLFKLENYVSSRKYSKGLFLWLTNQKGYLKQSTGDSSNFSTHCGRVYNQGTPLCARRSRIRKMPLPLTLGRSYVFNWQQVLPDAEWYSLVIRVE